MPLDGVEDTKFWDVWGTGPQFGTPLYYRPHLERFPERNAPVLRRSGRPTRRGAVHCVGGQDRTGQIAMLLLALADVPPEAIAADYRERAGRSDVEGFLSERGTSATEVILETLAGLDVEGDLRAAGVRVASSPPSGLASLPPPPPLAEPD